MSTIKVTNIEHASTANGGIQLDNAGHVTVDGVQFPTAGALSYRNLVINGSFQVAQRSTSRVYGQSYNALDRWATGQFQHAGHEQVSVSDSTVPTGKAIRVTSSSTAESTNGTRMALGQMIESVNCVHLAGKKVTLSFYIRFSNATFSGFGGFQYWLSEFDTTADQSYGATGATRSNVTTLTNGSLPTTWTKYTKTITCGSAMKNLAPRFLFSDLANTTNNSDLWYEVTAVQVEEGEQATPFEHRSFSDELAKCHRYFAKVGGSRVPGGGGSATQVTLSLSAPAEMRTTPNVKDITVNSMVRYDGSGAGNMANANAAVGTSSGNMYSINVSNLTSVTDNRTYFSNCSFSLDAEL